MTFGVEKIKLVSETPLHYLPNISKDLKKNIYIKRDDLTYWGAGGNKLRKLEYFIKDALNKSVDRIITVGGIQTNHGRLTATVATKYGLKCTVASIDDYPGEVSANILLDRIMGAEVVVKKNDGRDQREQFNELVQKLTEEYEKKGEKVYYIPLGGSNVLGSLGYFDCAKELDRQISELKIDDVRIITAAGSLGTYMGLFCGIYEERMPYLLTGISVMPFTEESKKGAVKYLNAIKEKYELSFPEGEEEIDIRADYTFGAYNNPVKEVREAIYLMARREGILLDPCYTGKAFAGLISMLNEDKIAEENIIFLHTGGFPGLYTKHHRLEFEKELIQGIRILD